SPTRRSPDLCHPNASPLPILYPPQLITRHLLKWGWQLERESVCVCVFVCVSVTVCVCVCVCVLKQRGIKCIGVKQAFGSLYTGAVLDHSGLWVGEKNPQLS